ncbi:MAG: LysR family transcriptional regulator, partial [Myxococcota bacterium]
MSDWDDYRFVLAVHRAGTVRGAAKSLGVNHATVSRRLGQLSGDPPLFERVRGGYQVTETGALWVRAAEEMEGLVMASERRTRAQHVELSGPLRLSLPTTLSQTVLLKPIAEFIRLHPRIELSVRTSMTFADLDRSEADVVVRGAEQPGDHLVGRRLFRYGLCCYSAPDYLRQTPPEERRWLRYGLSLDPGWIARSPYPDAPIAWVSDDLMVLQRSAAAGYGMLRT